MYFVGIDISKFKHDCTIVDELGDVSSHKLLNSLLQRPPGRVTIVQISKEVCAMVYFCICIGILFFALLFRLASTLRLTVPRPSATGGWNLVRPACNGGAVLACHDHTKAPGLTDAKKLPNQGTGQLHRAD